MAQYYFAAAYLPYLTYDTEKTISIEAFLNLCREQLGRRDNLIIANSDIHNLEIKEPVCTTLERWILWETNLRNQLVLLRAPGKNTDPAGHVRNGSETPDLQQLAQEAFSQGSPLAAEDILNRARWRFLDELEFGHYFDIDMMVIYYLKLQILKRKNSFNYEAGKKFFTEYFVEDSGQELSDNYTTEDTEF